jgi:UDP-glucose 4-epimerase
MRVLITGGAGFIGSALARAHLARGDRVVVVDNLSAGRRERVPAGARFWQVDVAGPEMRAVFGAEGPFDVVSHHAALKDVRRALVDPGPDAEANILGTLNVLRLALEQGVGRFVFPSSAAVYGDPEVFPTPETAPIAPISPYGISKAAAELYCAFFARTHGLPTVSLRYSTVYGPTATEESEAGSITIFTRRLLGGMAPTIYGDGEQTRDYVNVEDVVRANLLVVDRAPRPWAVYNVATGIGVSINAVCRRLADCTVALGLPEPGPPVHVEARRGEVRHNVQDASRLTLETGWTPQVALDEGLARVVAAYHSEAAVPVAAAPAGPPAGLLSALGPRSLAGDGPAGR